MPLKARTATTVIPVGCPMHNQSNDDSNDDTATNDNNNDDGHQQAYGGYKADNDKPIKVFKSNGPPVSGDAKKDWTLSKEAIARKQKDKVLGIFKAAFAICTFYVFVKVCLKTSEWLYSVPPEMLERYS
jgi:hypothetical protein